MNLYFDIFKLNVEGNRGADALWSWTPTRNIEKQWVIELANWMRNKWVNTMTANGGSVIKVAGDSFFLGSAS